MDLQNNAWFISHSLSFPTCAAKLMQKCSHDSMCVLAGITCIVAL